MMKISSCNLRAAVLIETLWNVKTFPLCKVPSAYLVLIETLWNVKEERLVGECNSIFRINRNIVECKECRICQHIKSHLY